MGVLREQKKSIHIEEEPILPEVNYGDYVFDSDFEEEAVEEKRAEMPMTPIVKRKKSKSRLGDRYFQPINERDTDGVNVKKNMGARKWRRIENARVLLSFASGDDLTDDYSDIVSNTITAFAKLFLDQENMKAWNDFIEKDEEDQRAFLAEIDSSTKSSHDSHVLGGKNIKTPKELGKMNMDEKRAYHPAYSAHACFHRLNPKFKSALTKRRVPLNLVDKIESRLREFFEETPTGVWVEASMGSFQRLYVHAVAHFLSLHSSSVTGDSSGKMIEVRNNRKCFIPPHDSLVPYLLERFHKPLDYDEF